MSHREGFMSRRRNLTPEEVEQQKIIFKIWRTRVQVIWVVLAIIGVIIAFAQCGNGHVSMYTG